MAQESTLSRFRLEYEYQEEPSAFKRLLNRVKEAKRQRTLRKKKHEVGITDNIDPTNILAPVSSGSHSDMPRVRANKR